VEPFVEPDDVTIIMGLLGDIRFELQEIRRLFEGSDGEEEEEDA
jgi:hypothetical protein